MSNFAFSHLGKVRSFQLYFTNLGLKCGNLLNLRVQFYAVPSAPVQNVFHGFTSIVFVVVISYLCSTISHHGAHETDREIGKWHQSLMAKNSFGEHSRQTLPAQSY